MVKKNKWLGWIVVGFIIYAVLFGNPDRTTQIKDFTAKTVDTVKQVKDSINKVEGSDKSDGASEYKVDLSEKSIFTKLVDDYVVSSVTQRLEDRLEQDGLISKSSNEILPHIEQTKAGQGHDSICGQKVSVHYEAFVGDKLIDNTRSTNSPLSFVLGAGEVISGLEIGIMGMKAGGKRNLYIPAAIGFDGKRFKNSAVPEGSDLLYKVELLEVSPNIDVSKLQTIDKKIGKGAGLKCGENRYVNYHIMDKNRNLIKSEKEKILKLGRDNLPIGLVAGVLGMKKKSIREITLNKSNVAVSQNGQPVWGELDKFISNKDRIIIQIEIL